MSNTIEKRAKDIRAGDTIWDDFEGTCKVIKVEKYGDMVHVKSLDRLGSLVNTTYDENSVVIVREAQECPKS